jgi:hypothetical protein
VEGTDVEQIAERLVAHAPWPENNRRAISAHFSPRERARENTIVQSAERARVFFSVTRRNVDDRREHTALRLSMYVSISEHAWTGRKVQRTVVQLLGGGPR